MTPEEADNLSAALEPLRQQFRKEGYEAGWRAALLSVHACLVQEAISIVRHRPIDEAGKKRFDEIDPAIKFLEQRFEELRNLAH